MLCQTIVGEHNRPSAPPVHLITPKYEYDEEEHCDEDDKDHDEDHEDDEVHDRDHHDEVQC